MAIDTDLGAGLADHRIRLRNFAPGNHKVVCPECSAKRKKSTDPCLSVTVEAGGRAVWNCHHCGWSGAVGGDRHRPAVARKTYRKPERVAEPQRPETLVSYFASRGITKAVIERFGVFKTRQWFPQTEREEDCIAFPYEWGGELRNVKYRTAQKLFKQEKDPEPVFYNADSIAAGEDLIVTEGEVDVLSFAEAGFEHVVSLPNGAPKGPEASDKRYEPFGTHWQAVEGVKRILIATDMDEPGEALANEIARRVGKDRCWRVRMPSANDVQIKDANEALKLYGAQALQEAVAAATPWPIDGLYGVAEYYEGVADLYHGRGPQPMSTGWPEMDKAFRYIPGQFIVVTGIPNHGKSRWLDQAAVQSATMRGEKWVVFSPEGSIERHIADLAEMRLRQPFSLGPTPRMSESAMEDALVWLDQHFQFISTADHTPSIDWILDRAKASVLRNGAKNLIIDPYNEVEASRPPNQTETEFISQLVSKCKRFGRHHEVTVWMVVHPTKLRRQEDGREPVPGLYDLSGSAHWRNKCDAGIVIYRDHQAGKTFVTSQKLKRQPEMGQPGVVSFIFNTTERRFEDIGGSFSNLGG